MPAAVHTILVARSTPRDAKALERTLAAVREQSRPVDALTIVVCGSVDRVREFVTSSGAESVIEAPTNATFAAAVELGYRRVRPGASAWLLTHDATPDRHALAALAAALERGPSIAIAAPKLVDESDPDRIVSLGQTMTRLGRSVELADGEFDQGQYDASDDVLGSDVRGVLVRGDIREQLAPDRALMGVDEGLDMGVRAHLAGRRVALVPGARVTVPHPAPGRMREAYIARTAQLHRRLAYAPAWAVLLHLIALLPLALWKTAVQLIAKNPAFVPAEWGAAATALVRPRAVVRSRRRIAAVRTASWGLIEPLRVSRSELRERSEAHEETAAPLRRELRFFTGGGAWAVIAATAVSAIVFLALLSWPGVGGGALLPLRRTVAGLWADAAYGQRAIGLDVVSAADPFSAVVAVLGSLWPANPSFSLLVLWLIALPLAVLGGWFAATRVTVRSGLRVVMAVMWALAPPFLAALMEGRPSAVLLHLLLPWLFFSVAAAHRSWGAAGSASLLLAAVCACAPSTAPALAVLWVVGLVLTVFVRPRGIPRVLWLVVPTAVMFLPVVSSQLTRGTPWAVFADPGLPWQGAHTAREQLATGFPTADPGGWGALLADLGLAPSTWWVPLLPAVVALLALLAPLTSRWRLGIATIVVAAAGLGTAFASAGIQVSSAQGDPVALWPGAGLSIAWLGVIAAAVITLDVGRAPQPAKRAAAVVAALCMLVVAVPSLTAVHRGQAELRSGEASTLPAFVAAQSTGGDGVATVILSPRDDGSLAADVVWGESETIGNQSTLQATETEPTDDDGWLAEVAADLVSGGSADVRAALAERGIGFVLLENGEGEDTDPQHTLRLSAAGAIDQRAGLMRVETARGVLWRIEGDLGQRPEPTAQEARTARTVVAAQLLTVVIALLLAVPTPRSHRAARRKPRVIGAGYELAAATEPRRPRTRTAKSPRRGGQPQSGGAGEPDSRGTDAQPAETERAGTP
jgi:GT2 family glycosyltransferase